MEPITTLLGIDPGFAELGIAVLEITPKQRRLLRLETFSSTPRSGTDEQRLDAIADRIIAAVDECKPVAIAYEDQSNVTAAKEQRGKGKRSTKQSRRVHEVVGIARAVARLFELPCYVLAPSSVKLAVLGRGGGNASKERVKGAVRILLRAPECSSHAADAAAVCVGAASVHRMHQIKALCDKASAINRKRKP